MSKGRRKALAVFLVAYLLIGIATLWMFAPAPVHPKADEALIAAFFDSLQYDTFRQQRYHYNNGSGRDWKAGRAEREARRRHRHDSAVHYWDSVRAVKDSIKAHRDTLLYSSPRKIAIPGSINLSSAVEDSLEMVPGIGPVLASRIIQYRQRLGGYVNVGQVLEAGNIPEEVLQYFVLTDTAVARIDVNRASAGTLRRHPYVSARQAEAILEARRKYGRIAGWHELLRLPHFSQDDRERLEPYLKF